jgi:hypothetical protein
LRNRAAQCVAQGRSDIGQAIQLARGCLALHTIHVGEIVAVDRGCARNLD